MRVCGAPRACVRAPLRQAFLQLLDSKKPQTVFLEEPLTVMLLYSTVGVLNAGGVHFYNDIYQRDAAVLESLNTPHSLRFPTES